MSTLEVNVVTSIIIIIKYLNTHSAATPSLITTGAMEKERQAVPQTAQKKSARLIIGLTSPDTTSVCQQAHKCTTDKQQTAQQIMYVMTAHRVSYLSQSWQAAGQPSFPLLLFPFALIPRHISSPHCPSLEKRSKAHCERGAISATQLPIVIDQFRFSSSSIPINFLRIPPLLLLSLKRQSTREHDA